MNLLPKFLKEYWNVDNVPESGIIYADVNHERAMNTNRLNGRLPFYAFTVIIDGQAVINYNGKNITLNPGDLYTYTPGFSITVENATDNYLALSLLAEEDVVFDSPVIRNVIRAAYFPIMELHVPKLSLSEDNARRLCHRMSEFADYQHSSHIFKTDMLRLLYSAFLLDLLDIQQCSINPHHFSERAEELFLEFIRLLPNNFVEHRDIGFYAGKLCVTNIYLSRIVRQITGRTVLDYINQMLLMEALWQLQHTTKTILQIAEALHFADHASFCRFFKRLKGISPKVYRRG
jgi:AraC-like DNA-binding protein